MTQKKVFLKKGKPFFPHAHLTIPSVHILSSLESIISKLEKNSYPIWIGTLLTSTTLSWVPGFFFYFKIFLGYNIVIIVIVPLTIQVFIFSKRFF